MIGSTRSLRVWAYLAAADLRKGFDGLGGLASQLRQDPLAGDCFLNYNFGCLPDCALESSHAARRAGVGSRP